MASSKFSRRPRIQQPPPVCRKIKFPPIFPFPLPWPPDALLAHCHWTSTFPGLEFDVAADVTMNRIGESLTYRGTATSGAYTFENEYIWSAEPGPVGIYQILRHPLGYPFHGDDDSYDLALTQPFAPPSFTIDDYESPDYIHCETTLTVP